MEHNLWTIFSAVADALPDREAVVWRDRRITLAELADRAGRLGVYLARAGLGPSVERAALEPWDAGQDLVGLYLLNCPEYLEATLGCYGARVGPFNVNYRYVERELAYLLDDAGARAVIYHERFAPVLAEVLGRLAAPPPVLLQVADGSGHHLLAGAVDYERALASVPPGPPRDDHSPDDLYVLYTGGTTGMPKGTLWRQADIWVAALGGDLVGAGADLATVVEHARGTGREGFLPNAPFMHGAAHWLALRQVLGGGTVVVNGVTDHLDPVDVWTTVERERVSAMLLVGEAFARPVLDELEQGGYDARSVRLVLVGGAVTSPSTKARILAALPGALVVDAAGSSETGSALLQVTAAGATAEPGVFRPGDEVAVLSADRSRRLPAGSGEIGWFAKQGRIPLGYLGDRAKTLDTFPVVEGIRWSVPGDRARRRGDGTVVLLGRDSVTVNSAGEKIFVEEVEQALLAHPDIADAVVVGRPSERWGEEVVAVVSARPGRVLDPRAILEGLAGDLARYKLPKEIIEVADVERSPAGKADYAWARQIAHVSVR